MAKQIIIGITGTLGAGKGTVVDFLVTNLDFNHYCATTFISKEIKRRGMKVNRDVLREVANDLRAKNSPSYIVEELYKESQVDGGNCVIESLRAVGEVACLQKNDSFYLLAVDADQKLRYDRIQLRGGVKDNVSFDKFVDNEKAEMTSTDPNSQNLSKCISMADFVIHNDGTFEDLNNQIKKILENIKNE